MAVHGVYIESYSEDTEGDLISGKYDENRSLAAEAHFHGR
jgi:hypothetical protein